MALHTANTFTSHYGRLTTSVERLSTGLRVNSAADDTAGHVIRELMRGYCRLSSRNAQCAGCDLHDSSSGCGVGCH